MGKIDFMALKRKKQQAEADVPDNIPDKLADSYTSIWGSIREEIVSIELNKICEFKDSSGICQPFKINRERIEQIKLSASDIGIITPLTVRRYNDGYQIISGHHRFIAAKELHMISIPCIVRDIPDDEAYRYITESNIQRLKLLPSEYSRIFAEYMKHRNDIELTAQEIADKFNISKKTMYRYINILKLDSRLQDMADDDMINIDAADIICKFSADNQESVYQFIVQTNKKISAALAKKMKSVTDNYEGSKVPVHEFTILLASPEKNCRNKLYSSFSRKYNVDYSDKEWNELVEKLLDNHFKQAQ